MKLSSVAIGVFAFAACHGALAEPAVTVRAVELRAQPASDAKSIKSLPAESAVDVVGRQGAWVQLRSARITGWAKLFDIRVGESGAPVAAKKGGNGVADTLGLAMGTRGSSVTTGVRGLDADMLARASPNAQAYATLASYARNKEQANAFAKAGRLASREVAELGTSAKTASGAAK
ncbi:MAG: SH3 domain-containing protein [Betaproteobacteria bacterium]